MIRELQQALAEITGFAAVTTQPAAGAQGEMTGLLMIRAWHRSRGEGDQRRKRARPRLGARHQSRERRTWSATRR